MGEEIRDVTVCDKKQCYLPSIILTTVETGELQISNLRCEI